MRTREQNFFAMAKASIATMDKHSATWKPNRRVARAVADAKTVIAEIDARNQGGLAQSAGTTSQKNELVYHISELAGTISKRVKVYAADQNDLNLKQKMSFTKSDYHHMSDADLYAQVQNLIAAVTPLVPDLADYGVQQKTVGELQDLAENFKDLESQPRTIIAERKMHNAAIPDLLAMLRADLAAIDGLIGIFGDPDLEAEFKNSRIVIDRATRAPAKTPTEKK